MTDAEEILEFWFGRAPLEARGKLWFTGGQAADREIEKRFASVVRTALEGKMEDWQQQPRSALALIVLLDQFTRNLFRGTAKAFGGDDMALEICRSGIKAGFPDQLHVLEACFFFMPLEHSESMASQNLCVQKFEQLVARSEPDHRDTVASNLKYANSHRQIIRQFGRYPHRNKVLGRSSSKAEARYLKGGGATFGQ